MLKPELIYRKFDTEKYNFKKIIEEIFQTNNLSQLHIQYKEHVPEKLEFEYESKHWFNDIFYKALNTTHKEQLYSIYELFIKDEIAPLWQGIPFIYQIFPTYRTNLPGLKAINKWHRDGDESHCHQKNEINFHFPITKAFNTSAIWVESAPDKEDFFPLNADWGDLIQFNGNSCTHGNKTNEENATRISFDFRVLQMSLYDPNYDKKSLTGSKRFLIGEYYKIFGK